MIINWGAGHIHQIQSSKASLVDETSELQKEETLTKSWVSCPRPSHHVFLVQRHPSPAVDFIAALASVIGNMRKGKNCEGGKELGRLDGREAVEEGGGGKHQVDGGGGRLLCHGPWLPEDDQGRQGWQFPASTRQQKSARWRRHRVILATVSDKSVCYQAIKIDVLSIKHSLPQGQGLLPHQTTLVTIQTTYKTKPRQ